MYEAYRKKNRSREYVRVLGVERKDFVEGCRVKTRTSSPCKNFVDVSWVDNDGYPNNCFTVETLWGRPEKQPQQMPLEGSISLLLNMQPEDYLFYFDMILLHLGLHEAHRLANPFMEGIKLQTGLTYDIFVNQRVTERLEAPYQTRCTDYMKLWRENGGHGPLTGKACAEKCKMESMLEKYGCVAQTISYPEEYYICPDNIFPSDDIVEKCSHQCSEACKEVSYSLRQEVHYDQTTQCLNDENCKSKSLYLNIIFNRLEIEKFVHHPRYESVEVFSYVGGYMGMWLGISLVSLFDLAETIAALIAYPLRRARKKRKTSVVNIY